MASYAIGGVDSVSGGSLVPLAYIMGNDITFLFSDFSHAKTIQETLSVQYQLTNRLEIGYSHQHSDNHYIPDTDSNNISFKYNLFKESEFIPAVSFGMVYKHTNFKLAERNSDIAPYFVVSKLFYNTILSAGFRYNRDYFYGANGFGDDYKFRPFFSVDTFLTRKIVVGSEFYRGATVGKNILGNMSNSNIWNVFVSYYPNDKFGVSVAYVRRGKDDLKESLDHFQNPTGLGSAVGFSLNYKF
jgi:hypothetical protein